MKGTTIDPDRLMSITNDSHHAAGDMPVYAFLYRVFMLFMSGGKGSMIWWYGVVGLCALNLCVRFEILGVIFVWVSRYH